METAMGLVSLQKGGAVSFPTVRQNALAIMAGWYAGNTQWDSKMKP